MNKYLQEALRENEKILWEGKPENIKLFESPFTSKLMIRWALCAILVAFSVWYYVSYAPGTGMDMGRARMIAGVMILGAAFGAVSPIMGIKKMEKKLRYFVTNERVITLSENGVGSIINGRDLNDFTEATIDVKPGGQTDLYIGPMTSSIYNHAREFVRTYRAEDKLTPMVFYHVKDAFTACDHLPTHIAIHKCTQASHSFSHQ